MENENDPQSRDRQQAQQVEAQQRHWSTDTPGGPAPATAEVETTTRAETEAEAEAKAEAEQAATYAKYYDQTTNPDLTEKERDEVARAWMQMDELGDGNFAFDAQNGLMALLGQFLGLGEKFGDLQGLTGRITEAFKNGEMEQITETGTMPAGGALEKLANDVERMTPQEPTLGQDQTNAPGLTTPGVS